MKWTRLPFFRLQLSMPKGVFIVGKDSGNHGVSTYYYIELDGKVIDHGYDTQREAKKAVINLLTNSNA